MAQLQLIAIMSSKNISLNYWFNEVRLYSNSVKNFVQQIIREMCLDRYHWALRPAC